MRTKAYTSLIVIVAILCCSGLGFATTINVKNAPYNATGNGTTDDTAAIQNAVNAAAVGDTVLFPSGRYKITSTITVDSEMILSSTESAIISFDFSTSGPRTLLYITGNNVTVNGLTFDGTYLQNAETSSYAIRVNGINKLNNSGNNASIQHCSFTNLNAKGSAEHTLNVTHAAYLAFSSNSDVSYCNFDSVAGAAIFITNSDETTVYDNDINNTGWYSIHYGSNCHGAQITANTITGNTPGIRYYGGSIDIMSQVPDPRCSRILIDSNSISGVHSYGAAIRVQSNSYAEIANNIIENATATTGYLQYIAVDVRSGGNPIVNNGPPDHILVRNNTLNVGEDGSVGIYVKNYQQGTEMPLQYGDSIIIKDNHVNSSVSDSKYFDHGIIVHGHYGGLRKVDVSGNVVSGRPGANDPISGAIGLICVTAMPGKPMDTVSIENNQLTYLGGNPSVSDQVGLFLDQCNEVEVRNNQITGFYYGVRLYTSVGTNIYGLNVAPEDSTNTFTSNVINIVKPSGYTLNTAATTITVDAWTMTASDLIAYYKFDNDVLDSAGNHNGISHGNPVFVAGVNGQAIRLDGSGDYVEVAHDDSLNFTDSITIAMWVRPNSYNYGSATHLIAKYTSTTDANFRWYFRGIDYAIPGQTLVYANAGGTWMQVSGNHQISLSGWRHLAWTYNKSGGGVLYVDGVRIATTPSFTGSGRLATNQAPILIGAWDTITNFFVGDIDELKIWKKELSKTEIEAEAGL